MRREERSQKEGPAVSFFGFFFLLLFVLFSFFGCKRILMRICNVGCHKRSEPIQNERRFVRWMRSRTCVEFWRAVREFHDWLRSSAGWILLNSVYSISVSCFAISVGGRERGEGGREEKGVTGREEREVSSCRDSLLFLLSFSCSCVLFLVSYYSSFFFSSCPLSSFLPFSSLLFASLLLLLAYLTPGIRRRAGRESGSSPGWRWIG